MEQNDASPAVATVCVVPPAVPVTVFCSSEQKGLIVKAEEVWVVVQWKRSFKRGVKSYWAMACCALDTQSTVIYRSEADATAVANRATDRSGIEYRAVRLSEADWW